METKRPVLRSGDYLSSNVKTLLQPFMVSSETIILRKTTRLRRCGDHCEVPHAHTENNVVEHNVDTIKGRSKYEQYPRTVVGRSVENNLGIHNSCIMRESHLTSTSYNRFIFADIIHGKTEGIL